VQDAAVDEPRLVERDRQDGRREVVVLQAIDPDRFVDILKPLFTEKGDGDIRGALDRLDDLGSQKNGSRVGQRFHAGGNVDAVAENVVLCKEDVAQVEPHPELESLFFHLRLDIDRAVYGVQCAGETAQGAVAHFLDQYAVVQLQRFAVDAPVFR